MSDEVAEWRPQLDGGIVEGVCGKQKAPWVNTTVANQRRECRKAEQKWKKTQLQIDYDFFERETLLSYPQR